MSSNEHLFELHGRESQELRPGDLGFRCYARRGSFTKLVEHGVTEVFGFYTLKR